MNQTQMEHELAELKARVNETPYYSTWATYTATLTGFSGSPTQSIKYLVNGKVVFLSVYITGTSNLATFSMTLPVACSIAAPQFMRIANNGASVTGMAYVNASSTIDFYVDANAGLFTNSGTKGAHGILIYPIA